MPKASKGHCSLANFSYQNAKLNTSMEGYGNKSQCFEIDGKRVSVFEIPGNLEGEHNIKIIFANIDLPVNRINKVANHVSCATPVVDYASNKISWQNIENASSYKLFKIAVFLSRPKKHSLRFPLLVKPNTRWLR